MRQCDCCGDSREVCEAMNVTLESGRAVCLVEGDDGEEHPYEFLPCELKEDEVALECANLEGGEVYRVARDRDGVWRCSCPDMIYSRRRKRKRPRGAHCKHIEALFEYLILMEAMSMAKSEKVAEKVEKPAAIVPDQGKEEVTARRLSHVPAVYGAIRQVMAAMSVAGVAKSQYNQGQKFNFRGIDDVMNALSAPLVEAGLLILPRLIERAAMERGTKTGGAVLSVSVEVEYDFIAVSDGSMHTIKVPGEAMDSGDKATNKAMSAAYKYACIQAFCIPTTGMPDADAESPEVAAAHAAPQPVQQPKPPTQAQQPAPPKQSTNGTAQTADARTLWQKAEGYDASLANEGLCEAGELLEHLRYIGTKAGFKGEAATWSGAACAGVLREATRDFETRAREEAAERAAQVA
jgi:hypothetical protein